MRNRRLVVGRICFALIVGGGGGVADCLGALEMGLTKGRIAKVLTYRECACLFPIPEALRIAGRRY